MAWPWKEKEQARAPTSEAEARARTGRAGEALARRYLEARGLRVIECNYRVARGRSRRGGEVDLIAVDTDGTLVFVEVRVRRGTMGGAPPRASRRPSRPAWSTRRARTWRGWIGCRPAGST